MEPVREQILNLQHISYTYHTLQGETLALSDISFLLKKAIKLPYQNGTVIVGYKKLY